MTKYRVHLQLRKRPTDAPQDGGPASTFWRSLSSRTRDEPAVENSKLRLLSPTQVIDNAAIAQLEYVLVKDLKASLQRRIRKAGSSAEVVGVEVSGYGSIDLLLIFDQVLNGAIVNVLGTFVTECFSEIFDVPSNEMEVEVPEEASAVSGLRKKGAELVKKGTPTVSVVGALLLVGFLGFSFMDRLSNRWAEVDREYGKLAKVQAEMISNLTAQVTAKEDKREDVADKYASRIFEQAQKIAALRGPWRKAAPPLCEMFKPVVDPVSVHLVVDPGSRNVPGPVLEKVPDGTKASLKEN